MNPEIAAEWQADLISGKYKQTTGVLRCAEGGFCCLGVLCEQAVRAGIVTRVDAGNRILYESVENQFDCEGGVIPRAVRLWAEMESDNGEYVRDGVTYSLAGDNDDRGFSFSEIAAFIGKNFAEL